MTEIELKAHVDEPEKLRERLNKIAKFSLQVVRDDTYYGNGKVSIRIRKENVKSANKTSLLFTYKRKEKRIQNGTVVEVNDEHECILSESEPLEAFLKDAGFEVTLTKHKEVEDWCFINAVSVNGKVLSATYELCLVPPLGYFLEIEILSPFSDEDSLLAVRKALESLLEKAGISKDKIENRYYKEMLLSCAEV